MKVLQKYRAIAIGRSLSRPSVLQALYDPFLHSSGIDKTDFPVIRLLNQGSVAPPELRGKSTMAFRQRVCSDKWNIHLCWS
jgi:hypothetical protein